MVERLLLVLLFGLALVALAYAGRLAQRRRLAHLARRPSPELTDGRPVILYFTTAQCAQCRLQQTPILERLLAELSHSVVLRRVDALAHEDLARRYGVLTVPTTVILDAQGRPRAINHGLATAERLREQLRQLASEGGREEIAGRMGA